MAVIELRGGTHRLSNLLEHGTGILDGLIATDVAFVGPDIAMLSGNEIHLVECAFKQPVDSWLWEIEKARTEVTGAIMLRNPRFLRCTFDGVGFALPEDRVADFLSLINPA